MEDVTIRPALRRDLGPVVRLLANDPLGSKREIDSDPPARCYVDAFEAMEADPRNALMVAERAGEIVGCLQLTFIPGLSRMGMERAQIESVRVAESMRGEGLGQRLFEWAIERARERGCGLVQLTTDASRDSAHGFYRALGFVPSHVGMKLAL
jgi:GNAT superfamily N-acetyltransferase